MSPQVSLKSPREMDRGLRIWGLVMGGKPGKEEARPGAGKKRTGGRKALMAYRVS